MSKCYLWWQNGIIYQIYPRSYQDSNQDGIGDLKGIKQRLDYIKELNVDAIWLSPIYSSPMHDFGYDVSDYISIDPMFGTMEDFDSLLKEIHDRGMKLILDLVPNHTSDEHEWFTESRSSRDNPKRDWYIWRDPNLDGGPPNNWLSFFGGSAWTYDKLTGQYYLHQFVKQQPELNFRNPQVLDAIQNVMRFWLDKGVDGFRVDVIWLMLKDDQFRDNPINPGWDGINPHNSLLPVYTENLAGVHHIIKKMRHVLDEYDERMMVGEIYLPNEELVKYYGSRREDGSFDECHLPFNFQLIHLPWDPQTIQKAVDTYYDVIPEGSWPNWVLGNHDQHRIATRVGHEQARIANMLLLTLWGTPTSYYGDEIGMENVEIPIELMKDPPAVNQPEIAHIVGRDPERTPMQWDSSPNGGFTDVDIEPWLPLAKDYKLNNVDRQEGQPTSMLNLYKSLTNLRRSEPALSVGSYESVHISSEHVMAYRRCIEGGNNFLILLNFSEDPQLIDLHYLAKVGTIEISTTMTRKGDVRLSNLFLEPNEGLLIRL